MQKDDLVYVGHMLDMARNARAKVEGVSRTAYDRDENLRLALAYLIQTIGEAARMVSEEFQAAHPDIPWRKIIATRHHIVHGYLHVDFEVLWDVTQTDLPDLIARLEQIGGAATSGEPAEP
jgi:uncharacterized protein with HEPN domain